MAAPRAWMRRRGSWRRVGSRRDLPLSAMLALLMAAVGCGADGPPRDAAPDHPQPYVRMENASTKQMVELLASIHADALSRGLDYFHLNSRRAEMLLEAWKEAPDVQKPGLQFNYANELLYAGKTSGAIDQYVQLLGRPGMRGVTAASKPLYDALAIAYLRLGEQENCIANPSRRACILPITGSGVHVRTDGSRSAAAVYEQILHRFPADLQARWLLNVAYMTLGEYPHGVPERWLIPGIEAKPGAGVRPFIDVAMELGVDHVGLAGGVSLEDFDRDGHLDILATSYGTADPMKLYMSDGEGGFRDATESSGLVGLTGGLNTVHADYDNDGFADVLVLRGAWLGDAGDHPNSLLRSNGDGTFEDVTLQAGLLSYHPTQTAAWADFNNDGWIDLFIGNESDQELDVFTGEMSKDIGSHPSELFVNNGDGTFSEVAKRVGIDVEAYVKAAVWGDVDNDGLQDLYLSIMGGPNRLYVNRGGSGVHDWRFEERAAEAGVEQPFFSFPAWFWDFDNDGYEDIFVSSYDARHFTRMGADVAAEYLGLPVEVELPRVYRNDTDGTFTEVSEQLELHKLMYTMGTNFGDLDNDGFLDFYVGTGGIDLFSLMPNRMFHSVAGRRFEEVTFEGGFGHIQKGHAVAFGDLDNDGDQDIYAVIGGALEGDVYQNVLFENPGHRNSWATIVLEGRTSNRSAVGARLRVTVRRPDGERRTTYATVGTGGSFGASSLQQELGLGDAVRIEELAVTWPNADQTVQTFSDIVVDRRIKIVEGDPEPHILPDAAAPFTLPDEVPAHHEH